MFDFLTMAIVYLPGVVKVAITPTATTTTTTNRTQHKGERSCQVWTSVQRQTTKNIIRNIIMITETASASSSVTSNRQL